MNNYDQARALPARAWIAAVLRRMPHTSKTESVMGQFGSGKTMNTEP
jgi:hypothetical protein